MKHFRRKRPGIVIDDKNLPPLSPTVQPRRIRKRVGRVVNDEDLPEVRPTTLKRKRPSVDILDEPPTKKSKYFTFLSFDYTLEDLLQEKKVTIVKYKKKRLLTRGRSKIFERLFRLFQSRLPETTEEAFRIYINKASCAVLYGQSDFFGRNLEKMDVGPLKDVLPLGGCIYKSHTKGKTRWGEIILQATNFDISDRCYFKGIGSFISKWVESLFDKVLLLPDISIDETVAYWKKRGYNEIEDNDLRKKMSESDIERTVYDVDNDVVFNDNIKLPLFEKVC